MLTQCHIHSKQVENLLQQGCTIIDIVEITFQISFDDLKSSQQIPIYPISNHMDRLDKSKKLFVV